MSLKESNEITVKIKCELNEFYKIVKEKGFKIIDKFSMDDTYFIPEEVDLDKINTRDILSKAVLVRDIIGKMSNRRTNRIIRKGKSIPIPIEKEILFLFFGGAFFLLVLPRLSYLCLSFDILFKVSDDIKFSSSLYYMKYQSPKITNAVTIPQTTIVNALNTTTIFVSLQPHFSK